MKEIILIYGKENKTLIKKIVSKLESDGISCWVAPRDFKQEEKESLSESIKQSKILVLLVSKSSSSSSDLQMAINLALENEIKIIPFVVEKIEPNIYSEYFFNQLSWIDGYSESFDSAYDLLKETFYDLTGTQKSDVKKNIKKKNAKNKTNPLIYFVSAAIVLVLGYFIFSFITEKEGDGLIVGNWVVSDYQDNLPGHNADSIAMIRNFLKQSGRLTINEDKTFERRGFSNEPQIGKWEINPEQTMLFLEPKGIQNKDIVNIEKLTENELVIFVNETINSTNVTTKIFFTK